MPIVVECGLCGKKNKFPDHVAGTIVTCRSCGVALEIPGGQGSEGDEAAIERRPPKSSGSLRAGRKRSRQNNPPAALLVVGGVLAAIVLVGLLLNGGGGGGAVPPPPAGFEPANPFGGGYSPPVATQPFPPPAPSPPPARSPAAGGASGNNVATTSSSSSSSSSPDAFPPGSRPHEPPRTTVANVPKIKPSTAASTPTTPSSPPMAARPEPAHHWEVQPDPPPDPLPANWDGRFRIRVAATATLLEHHIVYPKTPSPFVVVALQERNKEWREIWDLSTGQLHYTLRGHDIPPTAPVALSPDAHYAAWKGTFGGLDVFDVAGKKLLGNLPVTADGEQFFVSELALLPGGRLVAQANAQKLAKVWQLPQGELTRSIPLGDKFAYPEKTAFSPGGRFMAVEAHFAEWTIRVYDLDTGNIAGEIQLKPLGVVRSLSQLAFSPDGSELACVMDVTQPASVTQILVWSLADGRVAQNLLLSPSLQTAHKTQRGALGLQWSLDGRRFLVHGIALVDRAAEKVVYVFQPSAIDAKSTRKLLASDLIAEYDGNNRQGVIKPLSIRTEDVAQATAVVEAGGLPEDLKLPPLTKASDLTTAPTPQGASEWSATPDPAATLPDGLLATPLPLSAGKGAVRALLVSGGDSPKAFVRVADGETRGDPVAETAATDDHREPNGSTQRQRPPGRVAQENWIDIYDLRTRKPAGKIPVPFSADLVSVSPDGARVLVQAHHAPGRLDVYDVLNEHVVGFRPYQSARDEADWALDAARFIDSHHILTINRRRQLAVWSIPSCQAVYQVPQVALAVLSPGRKLLACAGEQGVELRDALTGAGRGSLPVLGRVRALAFSPQGDRLAILRQQRGSSWLVVADLASGNQEDEIPFPLVTAKALQWCGERHLLCDESALFDLESQSVVWSYRLDGGLAAAEFPDGRFWYASPSSRAPAWHVVAATLPEEKVAALLAEMSPKPELLVQPGLPLTVKWDFKPVSWAPTLAPSLPKFVRSAVEQSGFEISEKPAEPLKLTITGAGKTGAPFEFSDGGNRPGQQTVQDHLYEIKVVYTLGNDLLWQTEVQFSTKDAVPLLDQVPANKSVQQALNQLLVASIQRSCEELEFPAYVFSKKTAEGMGVSTFSGDGIVTGGLNK
jgi:WD40 repeat protein